MVQHVVCTFWKTNLKDTSIKVHFLPVDKSHTHALAIQRHQALKTRWLDLLIQAAFSDAVKPGEGAFHILWPLRGINKIAWGAKLILTADLAFSVSYVSMGHLLMAQLCPLCLNVCFSPPTAPHSPPPPTPSPPIHPPQIDSICDITCSNQKNTSKTRDVQIAYRISYELLAIIMLSML